MSGNPSGENPARGRDNDDSPADKVTRDLAGNAPDNVKEETLWKGNYSGWDMVGHWAVGGLLTVLLLGLNIYFWPTNGWVWMVFGGLLAALWLWIGGLLFVKKFSINYELTTQRFIHRVGLLSQTTERIELLDIDDVTCFQNVVQRFVGVGTIKIASSDKTHPQLSLPGIPDVRKVADLIDDTRRKERRKRSVRFVQD